MTGWKDWQIGEVVTESDFQNLVQDQVVQRYADAATRTSTLGTAVAEGMVSYLEDTNSVQVYNGTDWVAVGDGDITSVTAGTGLSGGGTAGDVTLSANFAAIGSALSLTTGTAGGAAYSTGTAGIQFSAPGTAGQVLTSTGTAVEFANQVSIVPSVNTIASTATTYTVSASDANDLIYSLATASVTIGFPDVLNIGERIDIIRDGAGTVILAAGTGVTSWAGAGTAGTAVAFKIDEQYNAATVQKVAANSYRVIGRIIP